MTVLYADTSALVRAYFADEPDHDELQRLVFEGDEPVVTSELARVELASAVAAAGRRGNLERPGVVLDRFDADCGEEGSVILLRLEADVVMPAARDLVLTHRLRTLDALHLAVATTTALGLAGTDGVCLLTRDDRQAEIAEAIGLTVR